MSSNSPDLAVETLWPDDRPGAIAEKVGQWLQSGTRLVWLIDPEMRAVTVHRPGSAPRALGDGEVLEGEDVVPGFRMQVANLWV